MKFLLNKIFNLQNMNINISKTYEEMSRQAANDLLDFLSSVQDPLLCTASGDSPKGLYQELQKRVHEKGIDVSDWKFLSLDEWSGMNENDEGSCRFHLNNDLFDPLNVDKNQITFFDGKAQKPQEECERIEKFILENRGIDISVIGLGLNGHVGMNEPGTSATSRTHVSEIHPVTQQAGQKYFIKERNLTHGLTLGIQNLMESKFVMLLVSGKKKAEMVKKVVEEEITNEIPASFLRNHPNFYLYLDLDASSNLQLMKDV